jgi:transketolase C-terminal domain/subunit
MSLLKKYPCLPLEKVGIKDTFAELGKYDGLWEKYGLGVSHIFGAAKKGITRKKEIEFSRSGHPPGIYKKI